ncbi:MAG: fibronectin type III domain-containing protein, partial [Oscillospiraceae bacterium]
MKKSFKKIRYYLLGLVLILSISPMTAINASAAAEITITGASGGTYISNSTAYIFPAINVSCSDNITGGTVNINGFVSGDTLSWTDGSGVSGSFNSSKGVMTIFGSASAASYQTFLRSITFRTSATSGSRTFEILLSNSGSSALYYSGTGHFYEYVSSGTTWSGAFNAAAGRKYSYGGIDYSGYLATITSSEENAFITDKLGADAWIGASDSASEGTWKWVAGPENGNTFSYSNWNDGEPNDSSGEDYAEIYCSSAGTKGKWNDLNGTGSLGYVVEYGTSPISLGSSGSASSTYTVTTVVAPTVATKAATGISSNSATLNGNVSYDGGGTVTGRGFNQTGASGSGTGSFSASWTGLAPNTYYTYYAYATNSAGTANGSSSGFYTLAAVPGLTAASPQSDGSVVLTLNKNSNSNSTQYLIQCATDSGFTTGVKTALDWTSPGVGSTLTVPKSVISPGVVYYYRIMARNAQNAETAYGALTVSATGVSPAPSTVTVTADTDTQATVTWSAADGAVSYDVYENDVKVASATAALTLTRNGLTPNTAYKYEVVSKNAGGDSPKSTAVTKYTLATLPQITSAATYQNGSIILTVDKKLNPDSTTKYTIERSQDSSFGTGVQIALNAGSLSGTTTVTVSKSGSDESAGVLPAKTYYFRIKAINGNSVSTAYFTTTTGAMTVPEIPSAPVLTSQLATDGYGVKQIKLEWTSVTGAVSYDIFDGSGNFITTVTGGTTYTYKNNLSSSGGLAPNTNYTFKIVARNAGSSGQYDNGCSQYSNSSSVYTFATTPDVDGLAALADGNVSLKVDEKDNPNTTEYLVQTSTSPDFSGATTALSWTNPGADHLLTISGLNRGTVYYFRVMARNGPGTATVCGSITGSICTIPADIGSAPTVSATSASQLNISWPAAVSATSYDVYYSDGTFLKNVSVNSTSDTGLSPNAGKQYKIIAKNSSGRSINFSPTSTICYTYSVVPSLTLSPQKDGSINVSVSTGGNGTGTQYYIEYSAASDFSPASSSAYSTNETRSITGLARGTKYYFRVKAKNGGGIETSYSAGASATTILSAPTISAATPSVDGTNFTNTVSWSAVAGALSYNVYRDGVLAVSISGTSFAD